MDTTEFQPTAFGCAAGPNQVARDAAGFDFADFDAERSAELVQRLGRTPNIVHFEQGRVIPIDLALDSKLFGVEEDFLSDPTEFIERFTLVNGAAYRDLPLVDVKPRSHIRRCARYRPTQAHRCQRQPG